MASSEEGPVRRKISELRVVDLRAELEKRGLDKNGVKAVLIEKLQKALQEEGENPNEVTIDGSQSKAGARKITPRKTAGKADDEHEEPMEEIDAEELMDGEFLQVDSTGDQSNDGLSQEDDGIPLDGSDQIGDEDIYGKLNPDSVLDEEMDDLTDDAINITAEDDQLLTEDEAVGDQSDVVGASGNLCAQGVDDDQFETPAATTDNSTTLSVGETTKATPKAEVPVKQEVDNESLVVHVDEPSLLELDADLTTKPEEKQSGEDSSEQAAVKKEPGAGKEKWEFETQEKMETEDEKADKSEAQKAVEKTPDNKTAGKESAGDKKTPPSASSSTTQRRSSSGSSSSKPGSEKDRRPGSGRSGGRNLWVCNLSKTTRAADLKAAFSKYGKVAGAKVVTNARSPGTLCYGFVIMSSSSEAQRAMNHLHRTELHGRTIHVEWAGNDPVPGGRKPPMIPPSLLAAEKEKERERQEEQEKKEAKDESKTGSKSKTSSSDAVKVEKSPADKNKPKAEGTGTDKDEKKPSASTQERSSSKPADDKTASEKGATDSSRSQSQDKKDKDKDKKDVLSLDKIKEQREKDRQRNRERELREIERRRERERTEQFRRQRDLLRRRTREEEEKIRREREQLKLQRLQLEQERLERERLERERIRLQQERQREQERLERERALGLQLRIEQEHRTALKRTFDARGLPMHDPYLGDQKRLALESGLLPPPPVVMPPPMEMQGGMMNNQRMQEMGGDRRFDRRDHRGPDGPRRDEPPKRFGPPGSNRFREDNRQRRDERGPPRRDDPRKDVGRREDPRRDEPRRSDPRRDDSRRDDSRREDSRKDSTRREPSRREEVSRRDEPPRDNLVRRSDNRKDDSYRRDSGDQRGIATSHQRPDPHRREEPPRRDPPPRREQHPVGRFGDKTEHHPREKDERRVVTANRNERFEQHGSRAETNQFSNQHGSDGFQDRRRSDRERVPADRERERGRDVERERGGFTQDKSRQPPADTHRSVGHGGDVHFQRRPSPPGRRPQQSRDNWKQDHHSGNISNVDNRRVTGHDTWKPNNSGGHQTGDRRVELRTVDHHHERPAREIIDHAPSFGRDRMQDFQPDVPQDNSSWSSSQDNRPMGYHDRPMIRDTLPRHNNSSSNMGSTILPSASRSDNKWNSGGIDSALNRQSDRWAGGSLGSLSSSLASSMSQGNPPLNTLLGNQGGGGFGGGGGLSTNALGNLISNLSSAGSGGSSNFGLDRRNVQPENRFDSFQGGQGMRRF